MATSRQSPREGTGRLADLLRQERERAGLSKLELAARMGVAPGTVREAEAGRDPRHSTLLALTGTLPGLDPSRLLPSGAGRCPPVIPAAWRRLRDLHGLVVRRLVHRLDYRHGDRPLIVTELSGLESLRPDEDLEILLRRCFPGTPAELRDGLAQGPALSAGSRLRFDTGSSSYEVDVAGRPGEAWRIRWSRQPEEAPPWQDEGWEPGGKGFAELALELNLPIESLALELCPPKAAPPLRLRARSWTSGFSFRPGSEELSGPLHGGGRETKAGGVLGIRLDHALVGVSHALSWQPAEQGLEPAGRSRRQAGTAAALAHGRLESGLSRRELARRMDVSAQTVTAAEAGRDLRRSTLLTYAKVLPQLSSWGLLAEVDANVWKERDRLWDYLCDVHGALVEEEHKEVVVSARGNLKVRIHSAGLRSLRDRGGDLLLVLGSARQVVQSRAARLEALEAEDAQHCDAGFRIRRLQRHGRALQHLLRIPAEAAAGGIDLTRRFVNAGAYVMRDEKARRITGKEGPFHEGTSFAPALPTRLLRLSVQFPQSYWPEELRAHAWSADEAPDPQRRDRAAELHSEGLHLELRPGQRSAELRVDRPLPGFKYSLSWLLR